MRSLTLLILGIIIGIAWLWYGYIRLQDAQQQEFITTTQSTIVMQLQSLAHLTTMQMTVSKVIEGKKDLSDIVPSTTRDDTLSSFFFDDRLLMTIEAKVNAGIDFSKITTGDIQISSGSQGINGINKAIIVDITLPKAEIFDIYLTAKTKPFERKLGILSKGNQELETKMRNDAIQAVRQEAIDTNILTKAQENAESTLQGFLAKFAIKVRSITYR